MQQNVAELEHLCLEQADGVSELEGAQAALDLVASQYKGGSRGAADITVPGHVILGDVRAR